MLCLNLNGGRRCRVRNLLLHHATMIMDDRPQYNELSQPIIFLLLSCSPPSLFYVPLSRCLLTWKLSALLGVGMQDEHFQNMKLSPKILQFWRSYIKMVFWHCSTTKFGQFLPVNHTIITPDTGRAADFSDLTF